MHMCKCACVCDVYVSVQLSVCVCNCHIMMQLCFGKLASYPLQLEYYLGISLSVSNPYRVYPIHFQLPIGFSPFIPIPYHAPSPQFTPGYTTYVYTYLYSLFIPSLNHNNPNFNAQHTCSGIYRYCMYVRTFMCKLHTCVPHLVKCAHNLCSVNTH